MNGPGKKGMIVLAAGSLSLAAVAVSWQWHRANAHGGPGHAVDPAYPPEAAAIAESQGATSTDLGAPDAWKVGDRRTYEGDFRSSLSNGPQALDGAPAVRGSAKLELVAQTVDEARVVLRGQVSELVMTAGTQPSTAKHVEDRVNADLSRPFLVKVRRSGHVESIAFDRQTKGIGCDILRNLIATLAFVAPEGPNPDWREWTAEESDQHGIYKARYRQIEPGIFQKSKLEYSHVEMETRLRFGSKGAHVTIVSSAKLRRDRQGLLQFVESDEHMEVPIGNASFQSDSYVRLRLAQHDNVEVAVLDASKLMETPLFTDRPGSDPRQTDSARKRRELVGGASLQQLMTELERTPSTSQNHRARWDVTRRMSALFDLEPERLAQMGEKLKTKLDPANADMLLAAVSDSKAPEAQATLASLAADGQADPRLRAAATAHLGLQQQPTDETFSSLKKLAEETSDEQTRKSATLALGSAARQAREGGQTSGASQQAVDYLNNSLAGAGDAEGRRLALEALGNAADPSSLSAIEPYLHDGDPMLRRTAVLALRLLQGAEVDGLIAGALGDSDVSVRGAAMMALGSRPLTPALVQAIAGVVKNDADGGMRAQGVAVLGRRLAQFPEATAVLEWARDNDPSADVRKAAATALQQKLTPAKPHP